MLGSMLSDPLKQFLSTFHFGEISIAQAEPKRLMA